MWFSSVVVSVVVGWVYSVAVGVNGLVVVGGGVEELVDGDGGGVYVEPAPILPLEKRTSQEQDPCTYFTQNYGRITGEDWRKCILAVPFNEPFARQTIRAFRIIFDLESSSGYHESPPAELELPPFSLNATFDMMEAKINSRAYQNHWSFEYDLMVLFNRYRDGHTSLNTMCMHGYYWIHAYPIVLFEEGVKGKKVWEAWTVEKDWNVKNWHAAKLGDRIVKINDQPTLDWLSEYTQTSMESFAYVDPDSRMRQMEFTVPTGLSRGMFAKRQMWNGEELSIEWANGTRRNVPWTVQFTSQMVTDGKFRFNSVESLEKLCFLNTAEMEKMIAPQPPPKTRKRSEVTSLSESLIDKSAPVLEGRSTDVQKRQEPVVVERPSGYPPARVSGPEFAAESFILRSDPETAIIRFATFKEQNRNTFKEFSKDFQNFVAKELASLKQDGVKRLMIDVSHNGGGQAVLPYDVLGQLFPEQEKFSSMNIRWSPTTWALVQNIDNGRYMDYYRDENMQDFKSKEQWLGPIYRDGGWYSPKWKQDFEQYAQEASSIDLKHTGPQPFETENIIVISNGICASACASFVEGLQEHGVRAIAYGGRPNPKTPMQAVGGTKGGKMIDLEQIYQSLAKAVSDKRYTDVPPSAWMPPPMPLRVLKGSLNLENKFRDGIDIPLQYLYTPSCRKVGFNKEMFVDIMVLWEKARELMWGEDGKPTKCSDYTAQIKQIQAQEQKAHAYSQTRPPPQQQQQQGPQQQQQAQPVGMPPAYAQYANMAYRMRV